MVENGTAKQSFLCLTRWQIWLQSFFCPIGFSHLSILCLTDSPRRLWWYHWICWTLSAVGIFCILLAHDHYTVDVVVAYYITTRLFWWYHTMANQQVSEAHNTTLVLFHSPYIQELTLRNVICVIYLSRWKERRRVIHSPRFGGTGSSSTLKKTSEAQFPETISCRCRCRCRCDHSSGAVVSSTANWKHSDPPPHFEGQGIWLPWVL